MKLWVQRQNSDATQIDARDLGSEFCGVLDIEQYMILTRNALQIIPGATSSINERLNVVAAELILLDGVITDQL